MAAIIRFRDGTEAKLSSKRNEWECEVPHLKKLLERTYDEVYATMPHAGFIEAMAHAVAKELYAEVIYIDPPTGTGNYPPGAAL